MISIDTTNMCSHLQKKLFEEDGVYDHIWIAIQDDNELTAVVHSRQLHIMIGSVLTLIQIHLLFFPLHFGEHLLQFCYLHIN